MKRSFQLPLYVWACWLLSAVALALLATPYRDAGFPLAAVSFFTMFLGFVGFKGPKHHSRLPALSALQFQVTGISAAAAVWFSSWGNMWLTLVALLLGPVCGVRYVLFRWMGYTRFLWFEVAAILAAVICYVMGGLQSTHAYLGWVALGPHMLFSLVGAVMITKRQLDMRRVGAGSIGVGEQAPDFTLPSHRSETISLSDFRGVRPVVLFFVRGDWCPGCHIMLRAYERNRQRFKDKNTAVIAIGPDPTHVNREMVDTLRLEFGLLSDEEHAVARQYRVLLEGPAFGTPYEEGLPLPASFLIDVDGVIRFTSRVDKGDMMLHPEAIFPVLESLPSSA